MNKVIKIDPKIKFDKDKKISDFCKKILENASMAVVEAKEKKHLTLAEMIYCDKNGNETGSEQMFSYILNCQVNPQRNPWLFSESTLKGISQNLNISPYNLLWENKVTCLGKKIKNKKSLKAFYLKAYNHHTSPIELIDLFELGLDFLSRNGHEKLINRALESSHYYAYTEYFEPHSLKEAKKDAILHIFVELKNKFLDQQRCAFKDGTATKLNKQLIEFFENNLLNLLTNYVENASYSILELIKILKKVEKEYKFSTLPEEDEIYSGLTSSARHAIEYELLEQSINDQESLRLKPANTKYFDELDH